MQNPFTLFETSAFAAALDCPVAPDGDARSATEA
jgi:hypothetical protein